VASDRIDGLRQALELTPENHALRLLLAESLAGDGHAPEATVEDRWLHERGELPADVLLEAGRAALAAGDLAFAASLADAAQQAGTVEGVADLRRRIDASLGVEGVIQVARQHGPDGDSPPIEFESALTTSFSESAASRTSRRRSTARSSSRTSAPTSTRLTGGGPVGAS
jgi:hypothetical protein